MKTLQDLEKSLVDPLDKKAPYKLPPEARKKIASVMWIVALVVGVLQLWAAWVLWHLGHYVNTGVDAVNRLTSYYNLSGTAVSHLGLFFYVALLFLAADAVLMLFATPGLKAMQKAGWNLLFYSLLLNVVYGVVRIFAGVGGDLGQFVFAILGSLVGAYFLFQIRDSFTGAPAHQPNAPKHK